ncbi:MAG: EamA family transporter, partial [Pseudomonadota bacterium]
MISDSNLRGIVLMIIAMGTFAIADTLVKVASASLSPAQVLFYLLGGGLLMFAAIAISQGDSLLDRRALAPILWLRYATEVAGMVGMVTALALVPISTVGAITQATPLLA